VPAPLDTSGWYIRADVGVGLNQISGLRQTLQPTNALGGAAPSTVHVFSSIGDSTIIGGGVGYQFNNWFRGDLTGEYRTYAAYKYGSDYAAFCASTYCLDSYSANLSSAVFLANGYVDLGTWYGVTPFLGAGVGFAHQRLVGLTDVGVATGGFGVAPDTGKFNFAWALMAGLGYSVSPNLKLEVGYRYLNTGTFTTNPITCTDTASCFYETQSFKTSSHDFRIGMRWMLAGDNYAPSPPIFAPAPGPLVRKY
jgi:opacity protein-like surface antigen